MIEKHLAIFGKLNREERQAFLRGVLYLHDCMNYRWLESTELAEAMTLAKELLHQTGDIGEIDKLMREKGDWKRAKRKLDPPS